jgi:hypothetical protein
MSCPQPCAQLFLFEAKYRTNAAKDGTNLRRFTGWKVMIINSIL